MEKSVREILYDALRDLTEEQFKDFKWKLRNFHYEGRGTIPWGQLEAADRRVTIDLLYGCYSDDDATTSISLEVLERINARIVAENVQSVLALTPTSRATEEGNKLEYRNYLKEKFQTMKDQNSLPGEFVLLKERYSKLIILDHHRPEKEREHEILTSGRKHDEIMGNRDSCSITIQTLFQPDKSGLIPNTVVLQGAAGIGKTMTARKIMLDWASGDLYPDQFDYAFYIHCRGMNLDTEEKSMADVILIQGVNKGAIKGMLKNPQKLLFVIDGFDELRFSVDQPEDYLCSDPWKKKSMSVLLSSLFRKKLLPNSYLIITTRPTALEKLNLLLERSRYAEILGFSPEERREYFHRFFRNKNQAEKVIRVVEQNETLFTICFVPIVCWIICTVMEQQLSKGEDLVQTSNTITTVYMLYLSSFFKTSKMQLKKSVQTNLRGLCSLAADGIWKREILFWEEEIQKYGLDQEDSLPLFLNENIFKRDLECICFYSFIHLSFQEFFAALSYLLEDSLASDRDVETLLESSRSSRDDLALTLRFLFGLLNEEQRMRNLKEKFGWKISPRIKELLLRWVKKTIKTHLPVYGGSSRNAEVLRLLYEIQEEDFLKSSLDHVTFVDVDTLDYTDMDAVITSFCLKNCHNLEVLSTKGSIYRYRKDYLQHICKAVMYGCGKLKEIRLTGYNLAAVFCEELSRVLITIQTLVDLDLLQINLGHSGTKQLCETLRHPDCKLQNLRLNKCNVSWMDLSSVFSINQNLMNLQLYDYELSDLELKLLCGGLKHPNCKLQSIGFWACNLTPGCCKELYQVLIANKSLMNLKLYENKLGNSGAKLLCEALRDPACKLQSLMLRACNLTADCCKELSQVLFTNKTLVYLDLSENKLENSGIKQLCEALRYPGCKLQNLKLYNCGLSEACCEDFASVLSTNQTLTDLTLNNNKLGDSGLRLLCEGLKHPNCSLQELSLSECSFTSACCEDLASLLRTSQRLTGLSLGDLKISELGAKLLREGLEHPDCKLQNLSIHMRTLTEEVRQQFDIVKNTKPNLNIR